MPKIPRSIEIVISTNKYLSSMSLESRRAIKDVLSKRYTDVRITDVNVSSDLDSVIARKPDLVFLGMKFVPDTTKIIESKVWLSQRLLAAGISFTGSDSVASKLEHDKHLAKKRVSEQGISTARSQLIVRAATYNEKDITLSYPIFIKPVDGGGGSGINEMSLVHNFTELKQQITWVVTNFKTDVLLESYLPGREFSIGVLRKAGSRNFHLMPLEIVAPVNTTGSRYLSSQIKQADSEQTLEVTDVELRRKLNALAINAFNALGAQDYGRIDVRLDQYGKPHFLEANLLPSLLNNYGNLPKASLMNIGLKHEDLIFQITELAFNKDLEQLAPATNSMEYIFDGGLSDLQLISAS